MVALLYVSYILNAASVNQWIRPMKWRYYRLGENDPRAKAQVFENLEMGAYEHTLSKKLLERFSVAGGEMRAIAFESLDLNYPYLYKYSSYVGGKSAADAIGTEPVPWTDFPIWGLIEFLEKWLYSSKNAVVVCENLAARRKHLASSPRESRTVCYGDEVYHILTSADAASRDAIECALRESEHHWATGVCSRHTSIPERNIQSEAFFDAIVANTAHIFTPALDGEGYLIWSPTVLTANPSESRHPEFG